MPEPLVVGFVGLGRMGLPMCRRLLAAGVPLVVYNRTPAKAAPLASLGASVVADPGELAAAADLVVTCLDRVEASVEVFLGPNGVAARARPGTIGVDHGTIGPDTARQIAAGLAERGIGFLDAPVSGGPEGAEQGTLSIMAGGAADLFERVRPMMAAYGKTIVRTGDVGTGSLTKLVNQLLTFVHGAVAAEALGFAERNGLDLGAVGQVVQMSFGQSRMLERTLARVLAGNFVAGAPLRLYGKDLGLIDQVGAASGATLPLTEAAERVLARATEHGLAEADIAALYQLFRKDQR
ncbi:MAG: NAD(P)-dependent oxidoreductase [Gemmatimonadales bacterium]